MRPELAEPIRDKEKLRKLLPLAKRVYVLHESGLPYTELLKKISRIVGRIVDVPMVLHAFDTGNSEYFARYLLTDWHDLPRNLNKQEMLELLEAICGANGSPERIEYWLSCLEANTGEPELTNLLYWPDLYRNGEYNGRDLSPIELLEIALLHGTRDDA